MNPAVTTQRILYDIARRVGLEPIGDTANLSPSKAREILTFMDLRLREGWELYDFEETTYVEERAFADDYEPTLIYRQGAFVWDWCSRQYYEALTTTVGGQLDNAAVWRISAPRHRYIPWWQKGKRRIGTPFTAWKGHPYIEPNRNRVPFLRSIEGVEFSNSLVQPAPATVFLQFRIPYPGIGLDQWDTDETFNEGDATYYGSDTYLSRIDNNIGNTPPAECDANWIRFRIPWCFRHFLTLAAYSDSLIVNGQNEKAPDQLQQAYTALMQEYDKQTIQSDQFIGYSARVL